MERFAHFFFLCRYFLYLLTSIAFMTTIGDISFGAHFLDKNDETPEILIEGKFLLLCNYLS